MIWRTALSENDQGEPLRKITIQKNNNTMMTETEALKLAIAAAAEERERLDSTALFGGWVDYIYTAPDEDGRYLVWLNDMITGANYENGQFWPDAGDDETITHWAKISPPNAQHDAGGRSGSNDE